MSTTTMLNKYFYCITIFLLIEGFVLPSTCYPAVQNIKYIRVLRSPNEVQDDMMPSLLPSLPSNPLSTTQEAAEPKAEVAAAEGGGGIFPSLPSNPFSGGESSGGMINQPLAMMGGFSMLVMPMSDMASMMNNFQQFSSSMPNMPSLPSLPSMPSLPSLPSLPSSGS